MDLKCTCGSTDLIRTEFEAGNYIVLKSKKGSRRFFESYITAEPFVCRGCRLILFRVPEPDMQRLQQVSVPDA